MKIVLLPSKALEKPQPTGDSTNLFSFLRIKNEIQDMGTIYVLVGKENRGEMLVPDAIDPLIAWYDDVFPEDLLDGLPLLRDIQH